MCFCDTPGEKVAVKIRLGSNPKDAVSSLVGGVQTPNSIFRIKTSVQRAIVTRCGVVSV